MRHARAWLAGVLLVSFPHFLWAAPKAKPTPVPSPTPTPAPTPAPVSDAEELSLSQCIERALANAPALEAAEYEKEIAFGKLEEARRAFVLPEAKVRVLGGPVPDVPNGSGPSGGFPDVKVDLTNLGPFVQVRVEALQPLYTFGKLTALKKAAQVGVDAKEAGQIAVRNEMIYRVKRVYSGLVYLYSLKDLLDELQDRAGKARDRVEDLIDAHNPDVTEIDKMRLDVFDAETERRLTEVKSGIDMGQATLGVLLNMPRGKQVAPKEKMVRFRPLDIRDVGYYLSRAEVARPEIRQLGDLVAARKSMLGVAKSDFFPMIFVGGFYGYGWAPNREDVQNPFLKDDFNYNQGGVGLGFEQKLSFHITGARYDQAKAEYLKAVADREYALQGIEIEIRKAHAQVIGKRDGVESALRGFKAGRSWVTAGTLNFGVGLYLAKDLLEAFVAYSKVKAGYFDTINDYEQALAELAKVVGEEVVDPGK